MTYIFHHFLQQSPLSTAVSRMTEIMQYLSFCVWIAALNMSYSNSTYVPASFIISVFVTAKSNSLACMHNIFFTFLSADGHSAWLHILVTVNSGAVNVGVQVSLWCGDLDTYIDFVVLFYLKNFSYSIFWLYFPPLSTPPDLTHV